MFLNRILRMACMLCASAFAVAPVAAQNTIVVGHALDLSGPNGSIGRDYVAGISTYFDTINQKGGVQGKKLVYLVRDDHGESAESARLASALIKQDRADYLLGAIGAESTNAILAAPAFVESRHVLFAPLTDALPGARARVLFWRPAMEQECQFILAYFNQLGIKDVGIALQESTQNRKTYQLLVSEMARRGMRLKGTARISASSDASADAKQLSRAGAKLVLMIADTIGSAQFLKAFRQHDPVTFVAGTSLVNLTTLSEIAGAKATEWTVFSQVVPNPDSGASALQSEHIAMMKKFRDEPVSSVTLEGFAVAKTLVKVMQMKAAGKGSLQSMMHGSTTIDLGGLTIVSSERTSSMSAYVDIALFKRNGGLMY